MRTGASITVSNSVLGRAFIILSCFTPDDRTLSFGEIARRTKLPKATVYRLARGLAELGLVECSDSGAQLGIGLFELGELVPKRRCLSDTALPYLQDLSRTIQSSQNTVHLAVMDHLEVLYLEKLPARNAPQLPSRVGGRMPTYCTAVGKAMLAFLSPPEIAEVVSGGMQRVTPYTIVSPRVLLQQLARIRESSIAHEYEESGRGVGCVACPVLLSDGRPVAAISVSGWVNRMDARKIVPAVKMASAALGRELEDRSATGEPPDQRIRQRVSISGTKK